MSAVTVFYLTTCPCRTFRLWLRSREQGPARWQLLTFVCAAASFQTSAWTFFLKLAERKCCRAARQWTVSLANPAIPKPPSFNTDSQLQLLLYLDRQWQAACPLPCLIKCYTVHAPISAASLGENIQTRSRGGAEGPGRPLPAPHPLLLCPEGQNQWCNLGVLLMSLSKH